ncbi:MAG: carboxy terminal-processing peptidase [Verrucomicrobiota bacterium]
MKRLMLLLGLLASLQLFGADPLALDLSKRQPLTPGPNDARIARIASRALEQLHYSQQPLNDDVSSMFLDRYIDAFDRMRFYFLQSDIKEFDKYRTSLDEMTSVQGDTLPAYVIFERFLQRMRQQHDYVNELLKTEKFEFTGDERFTFNRKDLPRPKDLDEAKKLWRDRLHHEYLTEKVDRLTRKAKPEPKKGEVKIEVKPDSKEAKPDAAKVGEPAKPTVTQLDPAKEEPIDQVLRRRYGRILRSYAELDRDDVLEIYLSSLTHVYDPHTDYLGKAELDNFSISMRLSLFGIGAVLRSEDGYCKIVELMPGGPADLSKQIKPDDRIIGVAQGDGEVVDVVDMKLSKVVEMIRGPEGSEVRLTVADAHDITQRKVVTLIRAKIKLEEQEAKASIVELPDATGKLVKVGVIDLPSFYADFDLDNKKPANERKSTTTDVAVLLKRLKKEEVKGVILDLRRNGGGSLEEAINLTGLFIKQGPVVQVKDFNGDIEQDADRDPAVLYNGPLVVLTSRHSASASEILAGALQDYGRALIVGDVSTHGKGTVQTMQRLSRGGEFDPGALKVTIRKFYLPSGSSTQLEGVKPDVVLPSVNNVADIGESALENALSWDRVPAAKFEKTDRISPLLPELKRRSADRVAKDKDFAYLLEDIERYKKLIADKSVSLNEAERLREKKENEARIEARKAERLARAKTDEKTLKFGLKEANAPTPLAQAVAENSAQVARKARLTDPDIEDEEDKEALAVDVALKEAERILLDLISLLGSKDALAGS